MALVGINVITLNLRQESISADTPIPAKTFAPSVVPSPLLSPSPVVNQPVVKGVVVLKNNTSVVGTLKLGKSAVHLSAKDNGAFMIKNVAAGEYDLEFTTEDGKKYTGNTITVPAEESLDIGTQTLEPTGR